jgi:hypothetical protein
VFHCDGVHVAHTPALLGARLKNCVAGIVVLM